MKKMVAIIMVLVMMISAFALSGCSEDISAAENVLKLYTTSLQGYNLSAMKGCIVSDNEHDIGYALETMSEGYIQTDNYKKSIEDMYKSLGHTFEFTINSKESVDKNTAKFNVTFKYANVDEVAVEDVTITNEDEENITDGGIVIEMPAEESETKMDKYCRERLEAYIAQNPSMLMLDEIEYSDKAISLIAEYYKKYLQITSRTETTFDIIVSRRSGEWKIHTEDNREFFDLLTVLFG